MNILTRFDVNQRNSLVILLISTSENVIHISNQNTLKSKLVHTSYPKNLSM